MTRRTPTISEFAIRIALAAAFLVVSVVPATSQGSVKLKPETVKGFDQFVASSEESMANKQAEGSGFLWLTDEPARLEAAREGRIVIEHLDDDADVDDGLIHNWIAGMFVPGVTIENVLAVFKSFDEYPDMYPEVIDSRLVGREGETYKLYQRLRKKKVLTVVLDTWHDAVYRRLDERYAISWSKSTEIREVRNAGKSDEELLPEGEGGGFVWRIYLYWRLEQTDDGVLAECQSISLSRKVPLLLRWFINPIVRGIPRDSLERSLKATREAVRRTGAR